MSRVREPAAFVVSNRAPAIPVLVHAPHAGTWIPDDERPAFLLDDAALAEEIRLMTDHRTGAWAGAAIGLEAAVVRNRLSRLVVDPERFPDDEREEMTAAGMGFAYTLTSQGRPLRTLSEEDRRRLKARWYDPYAAAVAGLVTDLRERFGWCVIVDLHSYPRRPLPYELRPDAPRPEVCLGADDFHTPEPLAALVEEACRDLGLECVRNTPFAGCYVPLSRYGQDAAIGAVMLEVRRDVYLDEATGEPTEGEEKVRRLVAAVVTGAAAAA